MKVQLAVVLGCAVLGVFFLIIPRPLRAGPNDSLDLLIRDSRLDDMTIAEGAPGKEILMEMCRVTAEKLGIATMDTDLHLLIRAAVPRVSNDHLRAWLRESISRTFAGNSPSAALALLQNTTVHDVLMREQLTGVNMPPDAFKRFRANPDNFKDSNRVSLCRELERKQNTAASIVHGTALFVRNFLESANGGMPAEFRFSKKEIDNIVEAYESSLSNTEAMAGHRKGIVSGLLYSFEHISNHELQGFAAQWNSDPGRQINKATTEAYLHISERGGKVYGAEVARLLGTMVP